MSGLLEQTSGLRDLDDGNTNSQYEAVEFTDNTKSDSILRATVLIEDAINFRSIFHKVGRYPLIVYRSYYSNYIQRFLYLNIFVILILAFFESPSSLSYSSDITKPKDYLIKYEFPCGILESVDIFCLILFLLDASIKSYLIGRKQVIKSPWLIAYFFVLVISFVDCIVSLSTKCEETVRIRRYLRPFFLIQCSSLMKKTIKSLKRTLPQIISVFVLLLIHLYLFAIIGMLIFPRYYIENINTNTNDTFPVINKEYFKNKAFSTISISLNNLLILITTSNNPDITIQSYAENRFAALYYVTFLIIGLYSLMSLFIAVIYNQFKGFFQDSMMSSAFRQSLGIRAAFWVLHDKFHVERNPGAIPKNALVCVIKAISLDKKRKDHLLKTLDDMDTGINDIPETDLTIELEQFEKLFFDNLNDEISNTDLDEFFDSNSYERRNVDFSTRIAEFRKKLKRIYLSKAYLIIASIITIINIGCITVELHLLDDIDIAGTSKPLSYAIFGFSIFYLIENIIKIWALQWKRYTFNYLVLMDGLISFAFFVTQVIHLIIYGKTYMSKEETKLYNESTSLWGISRVINMLLIFRLIHLAPSVKVMYAIISTAVDIFRSLKPLFGIMAANYYIYALFGMQLFANKIRPESFDNKYNVSNLNEYCGTYKQLSYWALNFNDFYSSLLVLWHIMVINNWYVTVDAFVDVTNEWSRFYFYFWWFICPIVTLSMVISLILDLFVLKWERTVDTKIAAFSSRTPLIKSIHRLFNDIKWKPDDKRINDELIKHPYIDFNRLIHKADIEQDFSSQ